MPPRSQHVAKQVSLSNQAYDRPRHSDRDGGSFGRAFERLIDAQGKDPHRWLEHMKVISEPATMETRVARIRKER